MTPRHVTPTDLLPFPLSSYEALQCKAVCDVLPLPYVLMCSSQKMPVKMH